MSNRVQYRLHDGKRYRMKKETFFSKNPEVLTAMAEIISNNPDTWPEVISNNYGIVLDEQFSENNPLLSFRNGTAAPVIYGRVRGKSGGALDIHKAISK